MAPFLGPKLKEAKWKVESGMAMQRADPAARTATREMSRKTESEGHLSAASFGYLLKCICATKATESGSYLPNLRQTTASYVVR
jgi:hypothetical protein